jgi:hypothetical protein
MNRPRRWFFALFILPAVVGTPLASEQPSPDKKPTPAFLIDRSLTVTPRAAPVPALEYRFLPLDILRKPGNAVPIYLRLVHEQRDETRRRWFEVPSKWNKLPPDRLPLEEAKKFLDEHRYMLRQIELGARRQKAEWEYTLDAGDPIGLLLPDIQNMRNLVPLLILQARVAMAEGNPAAAVHHLQTGFCMSRQVAEAPFLISALVGMAMANQFADAVLDLIERPDAPNLYWALTVLPRPLIGVRKGMELEQQLVPMQFPVLADLDRPHPAEEWDEVLRQLRKGMERFLDDPRKPMRLPPGSTVADPASKSPDLEAARKYIRKSRRLSAEQVKPMPPAQVLVLYIADAAREYADDWFKAAYLPPGERKPVFEAAIKRLKAAPDTEGVRIPRALMAAMEKVWAAQTRTDRRIAALRAIEAVRMHAAAHNGQLPERLADVSVVPVPDDPGTGKPFGYKREGATAILTGIIPDEPAASTTLRYRIRVRGK